MINWTQQYIFEFLSYIGGLFGAQMAVAKFFMSGYQDFVADKSLLKKLYGEEEMTRKVGEADQGEEETVPQQIMRNKLEKYKEFKANFCTFKLISCFLALCCCCKCCYMSDRCRRQLDS